MSDVIESLHAAIKMHRGYVCKCDEAAGYECKDCQIDIALCSAINEIDKLRNGVLKPENRDSEVLSLEDYTRNFLLTHAKDRGLNL